MDAFYCEKGNFDTGNLKVLSLLYFSASQQQADPLGECNVTSAVVRSFLQQFFLTTAD